MSESKSDLAEWLLKQYDEIEQVARPATPGPWRYTPDKYHVTTGEEGVFTGPPGRAALNICGTGPMDHPQSMADAAHIALHDPAFVLADVAAKRTVVGLHGRIDGWEWPVDYDDPTKGVTVDKATDMDRQQCRSCGHVETWEQEENGPTYPCPTLLALAQPFRGRPGWRDDWAQESDLSPT